MNVKLQDKHEQRYNNNKQTYPNESYVDLSTCNSESPEKQSFNNRWRTPSSSNSHVHDTKPSKKVYKSICKDNTGSNRWNNNRRNDYSSHHQNYHHRNNRHYSQPHYRTHYTHYPDSAYGPSVGNERRSSNLPKVNTQANVVPNSSKKEGTLAKKPTYEYKSKTDKPNIKLPKDTCKQPNVVSQCKKDNLDYINVNKSTIQLNSTNIIPTTHKKKFN